MSYSGYNEELHSCSDCKDCVDGKCMFFDGADIDDVNYVFVCMYFVGRDDAVNGRKIKQCKHCAVIPSFTFTKKWFYFTCPKCGNSSATSVVHGIEVAIEDWNRYHADKLN